MILAAIDIPIHRKPNRIRKELHSGKLRGLCGKNQSLVGEKSFLRILATSVARASAILTRPPNLAVPKTVNEILMFEKTGQVHKPDVLLIRSSRN